MILLTIYWTELTGLTESCTNKLLPFETLSSSDEILDHHTNHGEHHGCLHVVAAVTEF